MFSNLDDDSGVKPFVAKLSDKKYAKFVKEVYGKEYPTYFSYDSVDNSFTCTHGGWSGYYKLEDGKHNLYDCYYVADLIESYSGLVFVDIVPDEYNTSR